jgi:hypothetical protein
MTTGTVIPFRRPKPTVGQAFARILACAKSWAGIASLAQSTFAWALDGMAVLCRSVKLRATRHARVFWQQTAPIRQESWSAIRSNPLIVAGMASIFVGISTLVFFWVAKADGIWLVAAILLCVGGAALVAVGFNQLGGMLSAGCWVLLQGASFLCGWFRPHLKNFLNSPHAVGPFVAATIFSVAIFLAMINLNSGWSVLVAAVAILGLIVVSGCLFGHAIMIFRKGPTIDHGVTILIAFSAIEAAIWFGLYWRFGHDAFKFAAVPMFFPLFTGMAHVFRRMGRMFT